MPAHTLHFTAISLTALLAVVVFEPTEVAASTSKAGATCAATVSKRLDRCLASVSRRTRRCHADTRAACLPDDPKIARALDSLENGLRRTCSAPGTIAAAGLDDAISIDGLVSRLRSACTGHVDSIAARAFGGPHSIVFRGVRRELRACLSETFARGILFLRRTFRAQSRCVRRHRNGMTCDSDSLARAIATDAGRATERIASVCRNLSDLVLIDETEFLERTAQQARCLIPTAHGSGAPLDLDCGPRDSIPVPPRATATQVVLDESEWGTRCGDGSPYAFWVHLAPEGSPPENVVIHMQGGGICLFDDDCRRVSSGLFKALDNNLATGGYMSNTNAANPFRDWTKVYLPYCTQDVHIGGGETTVFPNITVHRYGAKNVRAALRYVRDLLWAELDGTSDGYRPDRLRVLFGGTSAGGFGSSFNYHYLLDDLRWTRATAAPGAALGIDNGEIVGMRGLGILFATWGSRPMLPPYCRNKRCSIIPELQALSSPRLEAVAEQQFLNVSNQVDNTQVGTTFFDSLQDWIDAHRPEYCASQGLPGLRYFLPAVPKHIHTILGNGSQFPSSLTSHGITVGEWLGNAMADPGGVLDLVEEGDLAARYGVAPFACPVEPGLLPGAQ